MKLNCFGKLVWVVSLSIIGGTLKAQNIPPVENATPTLSALNLSPGTQDLIKLAESGVTEEVLVAYANNSQLPFNLTADAIVYLKDQGITSTTLTAMLNHDKPGAAPFVYNQTAFPPNSAAPAPAVADPNIPDTNAPPDVPVAPTTPVTPDTYVSDAPADVNYFYNNLSPYGSWAYLDGLGWCWQPRTLTVNRQWRPYCDGGHWVDTTSGWYWQSDYSWGWAPFHYGRWQFRDTLGWVWFPDRTWGPGWVTWRLQGDYCGWAPLPFRAEFDPRFGYRFNGISVNGDFGFDLRSRAFTFIALKDFGARDYASRQLDRSQANSVFSRSTVVNNFQVNNHNEVVNRGIPRERVLAVTHIPTKTLAIRDQPATGAVPGHSIAGGVIYRQEVKPPTAPVHAVAQRIDAQSTGIQHSSLVQNQPAANSVAAHPQNTVTWHSTPYRPPTSAAVTPAYVPVNNLVEKPGTPIHTRALPAQNTQFYYSKSALQATETRPVSVAPVPSPVSAHPYSPPAAASGGNNNNNNNRPK